MCWRVSRAEWSKVVPLSHAIGQHRQQTTNVTGSQIAVSHTALLNRLQQAGAALKGAWHFAKLYLHPVKKHELPAQIRVAPVW